VVADLGVYTLAGADFPSDVRALRRAIEALGLTRETVVLNDTFAALRAGTQRPWGVALICGRGINAAAVAPDGRSARFDAVGAYSGDWGGGMGIGEAGVAAAVRAQDGRGPKTSLARSVPAHFGLRTPAALTRALYFERIEHNQLLEVAPIVFEAATAGDPVARSIIDRLADELVAMASALIRRLGMTRLDPEVVLAGGVFRATDAAFYERIEAGIRAVAPKARTVRLAAPPVLGAALIGLDRLAAGGATDAAAAARLRAALEAWRERSPTR
jgi:N-acetylglucosamine kinase-like BadF-type ATPase